MVPAIGRSLTFNSRGCLKVAIRAGGAKFVNKKAVNVNVTCLGVEFDP
jgi:hypothetical protein